MWNDSSNHKKFAFNFIIFLILSFLFFNLSFNTNLTVFAETESQTESDTAELEEQLFDEANNILDDIDTNELDDYLINDFNFEFFDVSSFKDIIVKILNGTYFNEYDSLLSGVGDLLKDGMSSLLSLLVTILSVVVLLELFKNISSEKYDDFKKAVSIVFSLVIILILVVVLQNAAELISSSISEIFAFSQILFPILLNLILLSGATSSFSVYSSLSVFLLNTGSYLFTYLLMPLAISIMMLTVFGSAFASKRCSRVVDIFKSIFKYAIIIFFAIFGLFSTVNMVSSGVKDGVSLKLTKFAIKNYIPVLGGYISDGFNFVHSCSVLVKNAFGVAGILILFFMILKPLVSYFIYLLFFKILSLLVLFVGNTNYSDMFNNVSKCMSYFITVLVGVFMVFFVFVYLLIFSVSVVWWYINLLFHF